MTKLKQSTAKQRPIGNMACKENNTNDDGYGDDDNGNESNEKRNDTHSRSDQTQIMVRLCASDSHFIVKYL